MAAHRGSYPHPVIGHEDDVASGFDIVNVYIKPSAEQVGLRFRYRTDDPDLERMLEDGSAFFLAWWSCPVTLSSGNLKPKRMKEHADGATFAASLEQRLIREVVRVELSIVAAKDIHAHSWSRQHPDYGDQTFMINAGDFLADGGYFEFLADKMFDPMQPPLGSCFRVVRDPKLKRDFKLDFSHDDQAVIRMSDEMADGLEALGHRPDFQLSLVVLPALMETISFIERNEASSENEDLNGRVWYDTVKRLVELHGSGMATPLETAQTILEHPTAQVLETPLFRGDED